MKLLINLPKYADNRRFKNFISLFSGAILSQLVNFFFYFLLARTYTEIDFGFFSLFTSYVVLTSVLTNPQLPMLSLSAKDENEIDILEAWSEATLIYSFVLVVAAALIIYLLDVSKLRGYLLLIPPAVFLYTLTENRKIFYNQREYFRRSNYLTIIPRTSGNSLKLLFSKIGNSGNGLIFGEILGNCYTLLERIPVLKLSPRQLFLGLKSKHKFLFYNYPSTLAGVASIELIPFFLISLYGIKIAGSYFLFEKFILQPFLLTGSAIGNSQAKYISSLNPKSKISFFGKMFLIVSVVSFPAIALLGYFGSEILFFLTKKLLFDHHLLVIFSLFIPVRLVKGIIYIFHHSSLNWSWGFIIRLLQVMLLTMTYVVCYFYGLDLKSFITSALLIEVLGESIVIFKALKKEHQGSSLKYLIKRIISSSNSLRLGFVKFENLRARIFNKSTADLLKISKSSHHKNVFDYIYQNRYWYSKESVSGYGSDLEITKNLRPKLEHFIQEYDIKKFLDVPCGDFHWMKELNLEGVSYIGGDIVEDLIKKLNAEYASPDRTFMFVDVVSGKLPEADVIFIRDCFIHLSNDLILKALDNIKNSTIKYLLVTHSPGTTYNLDIMTGEFRELNFTLEPFNLPEQTLIINEGCEDPLLKDKSLGLWKVDDLRTISFLK